MSLAIVKLMQIRSIDLKSFTTSSSRVHHELLCVSHVAICRLRDFVIHDCQRTDLSIFFIQNDVSTSDKDSVFEMQFEWALDGPYAPQVIVVVGDITSYK